MNTVRPKCRIGSALGLVVVLGVGLEPIAAAEVRSVWQHVVEHQWAEAQAALARAGPTDLRERALAESTLALVRSPLPAGRVRELDARLAGLAEGTDELAAQALYLRARLHQVHAQHPEPARAAACFRELAERFPRSHWAQLGLVKLGLLALYATPSPGDPAARLVAAEALLTRVSEPWLRRDLHLQIAWAGIYYGRPPAEALPHLLAADGVGGLQGIVPEDLVLQIGELSLRAGDREQARRYFERFLREFPVSTRRYNVRQRLAELKGGSVEGRGS